MIRRREFTALITGAAVVPPLTAHGEKTKPVIGWLSVAGPESSASQVAAFEEGLRESGYRDGENIAIEFRWAEGKTDRLPSLASDLADHGVDAFMAIGPQAIIAARNASSTIPIVFVTGDPVREGLMTSFSRPEGNLTGFSIVALDLMPKRLELLSELVPGDAAVALLVNPHNKVNEGVVRELKQAADARGIGLQVQAASNDSEISAVFASLEQQHVRALLIGADPFFTARLKQMAALATKYRVPAMYEWREFPLAGGLVSYGPNLANAHRGAGNYTGRILNGAKPADLPVQQPTKFELVINLKTAKALGLTVGQSLLVRADEVIE